MFNRRLAILGTSLVALPGPEQAAAHKAAIDEALALFRRAFGALR